MYLEPAQGFDWIDLGTTVIVAVAGWRLMLSWPGEPSPSLPRVSLQREWARPETLRLLGRDRQRSQFAAVPLPNNDRLRGICRVDTSRRQDSGLETHEEVPRQEEMSNGDVGYGGLIAETWRVSKNS